MMLQRAKLVIWVIHKMLTGRAKWGLTNDKGLHQSGGVIETELRPAEVMAKACIILLSELRHKWRS